MSQSDAEARSKGSHSSPLPKLTKNPSTREWAQHKGSHGPLQKASADHISRGLSAKMQKTLDRLNIPLQVFWAPNENATIHGEIKQGCIFIYDVDDQDAIETFEHEVYEYKFKEVTKVYRAMVNSLIEVIEKEIYARKEAFFDFLPAFQEMMKDLKELVW